MSSTTGSRIFYQLHGQLVIVLPEDSVLKLPGGEQDQISVNQGRDQEREREREREREQGENSAHWVTNHCRCIGLDRMQMYIMSTIILGP